MATSATRTETLVTTGTAAAMVATGTAWTRLRPSTRVGSKGSVFLHRHTVTHEVSGPELTNDTEPLNVLHNKAVFDVELLFAHLTIVEVILIF